MPTPLAPRRKAYLRQSCRCCYCDFPIWERDPEPFIRLFGVTRAEAGRLKCTAEHLKAQQDGGTHVESNIAAACRFCNTTRHKAREPLAPQAYRAKVQRRVAVGRWHPAGMHRLRGLGPGLPHLPDSACGP